MNTGAISRRNYLVTILICLAAGLPTADAQQLFQGSYDADAFTIQYQVPAKNERVFTHAYSSPKERDDGVIYITSDPPGGLFGTKPGEGDVMLKLIHAEIFSIPEKSEATLSDAIPALFKKNHPDETTLTSVRTINGRNWVQAITRSSEHPEIIKGASFYSYLNNETLLYGGWGFFRGIPESKFGEEVKKIERILSDIRVIKKSSAPTK